MSDAPVSSVPLNLDEAVEDIEEKRSAAERAENMYLKRKEDPRTPGKMLRSMEIRASYLKKQYIEAWRL